MEDKDEWTGTASELLALMGIEESDLAPNMLIRQLNVNVSDLLERFGIAYTQNRRTHSGRSLTLKKVERQEEPRDDCDA